MIKLIAFDLWKTLAYRDVEYSTLERMLEVLDCGLPGRKFVKIFEESVQTKRWRSNYAAYENLCKAVGVKPSEKKVETLMDIREKAEARTKTYPFAISMLKQLGDQGYKRGLISNSTSSSIEMLRRRTKVLDLIEYPVFSFDVGVVKPDSRIFEELLEVAKCDPEEVIMIGDNWQDDVVPAKELGMKAVLFKNFERLKEDMAKYSIDV